MNVVDNPYSAVTKCDKVVNLRGTEMLETVHRSEVAGGMQGCKASRVVPLVETFENRDPRLGDWDVIIEYGWMANFNFLGWPGAIVLVGFQSNQRAAPVFVLVVRLSVQSSFVLAHPTP